MNWDPHPPSMMGWTKKTEESKTTKSRKKIWKRMTQCHWSSSQKQWRIPSQISQRQTSTTMTKKYLSIWMRKRRIVSSLRLPPTSKNNLPHKQWMACQQRNLLKWNLLPRKLATSSSCHFREKRTTTKPPKFLSMNKLTKSWLK